MAHLKVLTPGEPNLMDLLGPLPTEEGKKLLSFALFGFFFSFP